MSRQRLALAAVMLVGTAFLPISAGAAGDAATGEKLFKRNCAACHTTDAGKHRVGPSLAGVAGRTAGTADGYRYSSAMAGYGVVWDAATLDTYLVDPRGTVPGTKMTFRGLKERQDRENVITYLETQ